MNYEVYKPVETYTQLIKRKMKLVYIILYLIFSLHVELNEAECHKNIVDVKNNLTLSRSILKVHCQSRDDDLGEHFSEVSRRCIHFQFS